jgi:hypothetical protein
MEGLVKAATEFLAAILGALGFVGRPRRRAHIHDDLDLLTRLRDSPDFGPSSAAHRYLWEHLTRQVAGFSGVELKRKRQIPWFSVVLGLIIGLPLAYWTYTLDRDGFRWVSILPGAPAALLLLATLGMLFTGDDAPNDPAATPED